MKGTTRTEQGDRKERGRVENGGTNQYCCCVIVDVVPLILHSAKNTQVCALLPYSVTVFITTYGFWGFHKSKAGVRWLWRKVKSQQSNFQSSSVSFEVCLGSLSYLGAHKPESESRPCEEWSVACLWSVCRCLNTSWLEYSHQCVSRIDECSLSSCCYKTDFYLSLVRTSTLRQRLACLSSPIGYSSSSWEIVYRCHLPSFKNPCLLRFFFVSLIRFLAEHTIH